jgi:hypothetical protein
MPRKLRQLLLGVAGLVALALGGSAIAGAASSTTSTTSTATTPTAPPMGAAGGPRFTAADAPGTAAHESAEKAVTGADAEKAQAAAVASVGGGKAGAVTTNFTGDGYEVTVTKTDGSQVSVHLDSSFKVQAHPAGPGGPGMQAPPGAAQEG